MRIGWNAIHDVLRTLPHNKLSNNFYHYHYFLFSFVFILVSFIVVDVINNANKYEVKNMKNQRIKRMKRIKELKSDDISLVGFV